MSHTLRKTLTTFVILALGACQILPPGTSKLPDSGFRIQSHVKPDLRPFVECVSPNRDGSFTAYFGYENTLGKTITIPAGDHNKILENPGLGGDEGGEDFSVKAQKDKNTSKSEDKEKNTKDKNASEKKESKSEQEKHTDNRHSRQDRGQPTVFNPGRTAAWPNSPLAIVFHQDRLTWKLGENRATASILEPLISDN